MPQRRDREKKKQQKINKLTERNPRTEKLVNANEWELHENAMYYLLADCLTKGFQGIELLQSVESQNFRRFVWFCSDQNSLCSSVWNSWIAFSEWFFFFCIKWIQFIQTQFGKMHLVSIKLKRRKNELCVCVFFQNILFAQFMHSCIVLTSRWIARR